jgi:hypothetical protein
MKSLCPSLLCLGLSVLVGLGVSPALGQGTAAAAEALFQQARQDLGSGRIDAACDKFRQSDELDPAVGTKVNLADCELKRGRLATAWELFKAVEQKVDPSDPRYAIARDRREALEPRVPRLKLTLATGAPQQTTVRIGTVTLGTSAFGVALPLDPGNKEVIVAAPGRVETKLAAVLEEGKTREIEVAPGPAQQPRPSAGVGAQPTMPIPPYPAPAESAPGRNRTIGFVIGGIGLAGLVVGGVAGALTLKYKNTNQQHCDHGAQWCDAEGRDAASSGHTAGAITTAGLLVGAVGVSLGTYFLVSSGATGRSQTALVTKGSPNGGDLALVHEW